MHTSSPGSPFSVILSDPSEVSERDIEEATVFTGCFSRKWREQNKKANVNIFSLSDLYKSKSMKSGTWGVKGKAKQMTVQLELVLAIQEKILRAVPELSVKNKKDVLLKIKPGKIDKTEMLPKFHVLLDKNFSQEELLSALPPGGISIVSKNA